MIIQYLYKRFPIIPLSIYCFVTILAINSVVANIDIVKTIQLSFIYLLFFFHLRILDEFKDFEYDSKHHKDRPVPRGLVKLSALRIIGIICILIIFLIDLLVNKKTTILLVIAVLYTFLMFKEFFIANWLKRRVVFYLAIHELVFVPLFLFFYSSFNTSFWTMNSLSRISLLIFSILPIVLMEIGRKMKHRYDQQGNKTDDTYAFIWGEMTTIKIFSCIYFISGLLSFNIDKFNAIYSWLIVVTATSIFIGSYFFKRIIIKYNMALTIGVCLLLPLLLLL